MVNGVDASAGSKRGRLVQRLEGGVAEATRRPVCRESRVKRPDSTGILRHYDMTTHRLPYLSLIATLVSILPLSFHT